MEESQPRDPSGVTPQGAPDPDGPADANGEGAPNGGQVTEERVRDVLRHVVDPELGINIVDLGLVYDVDVSEDGTIHIEYTLTTMGCPIGPLIEHQMESMLANVPGVHAVEAEMVLRPPWTPEMMSEEAKAALGYF